MSVYSNFNLICIGMYNDEISYVAQCTSDNENVEVSKLYSEIALIIPSRIGSTRLSRKPLEMIGDKMMINHVILRAEDAGFESIYVATDSDEIAHAIKGTSAVAIMTDSALPSGTDRTHAALSSINNKNIKYAINLQGDMPFIDPQILRDVANARIRSKCDIVTPVVEVSRNDVDVNLDSNVQAVSDSSGKALYFSRLPIPWGEERFLYHVGVYAYTIDALNRFVSYPMSILEKLEKLEQLRALENGMTIELCKVNAEAPISVDTAYDLSDARRQYLDMIG
jgi:3-deoxy-manno-octulosonate cytidylyltransferase (CMP-KDO synthetase)